MKNKKRIFQILQEEIGLTPKIFSYYDENEKSKIDIYIAADRPDFNISTYSTIGLSEYSIDLVNREEKEIRVEFIGICESDVVNFSNILATCAFNIINDKYSCKPGTVYPNVVSEYYNDLEMKHIYFTSPYLWENLQGIDMNGNAVNWLLAMPISDNEFEFLKENGSDALEDLFEDNNIDVFNINRKSII